MTAHWLKVASAISLLLVFIGLGIGHMIYPDWFVRHSGVSKGGKLLAEFNRDWFPVVGFVFAAGAAYMLYELLKTLF